jgi:aspartate/methionine/tyrosine aminotransferase
MRTPMQELLLEVLAARHRLGEPWWHFDANPATTRALTALESDGLIDIWSGQVPRTHRALLTAAGRAAAMDQNYRREDELRRVLETIVEAYERQDGWAIDRLREPIATAKKWLAG